MNAKLSLSIALLILCPLNAAHINQPPVNPYGQRPGESVQAHNQRLLRMTLVPHAKEQEVVQTYECWKKEQKAKEAAALLDQALEKAPLFVFSLVGEGEDFKGLTPEETIKLATRALESQKVQEENGARVQQRCEQEDRERKEAVDQYKRNLKLQDTINAGTRGNYAELYDLENAIREHQTAVRQPVHETPALH